MVDMIDIASHQKGLAISLIKQAGAKAVSVKLTEGSEDGSAYSNPEYPTQVAQTRAQGLALVPYHYFLGINTADAQNEARWFIKHLQAISFDKSGVWMIDVEENHAQNGLTNAVNNFTDFMLSQGYKNGIIYSNDNYFKNYLNSSALHIKHLWMAGYPANPQKDNFPYSKPATMILDVWQYASDLRIAGWNANLDANWLYTDYITKSAGATPAPSPSPAPAAGWEAENGTFTLDRAINLRNGDSANSGLIATLSAGQSIKYDAYRIDSNGYVWIRQPRSNCYGYLATGQSQNGKRVNYWGSFK